MGFLSSMLPTIVGAGVGAMTGNPMLGAAAAGALGYSKSGSIQQGLAAGLAGYGGGALAGGMMGAGAAEIGSAAATSAAEEAVKQGLSGDAYSQYMQKSVAEQMANATDASKLSAGFSNPSATVNGLGGGLGATKVGLMAAAPVLLNSNSTPPTPTKDADMGQRYAFNPGAATPIPAPDVPSYQDMLTKQGNFGKQQTYFNPSYVPISADQAKNVYHYADGGPIDGLPVEQMSNNDAIGANTMYPMANMTTSSFATPYQTPVSTNMIAPSGGAGVNQNTGELNPQGTRLAKGGLSDAHYNLGGYSDGGRLLRGPGDGVSDSIPAVIGEKQPARLADGEFVVPARIVSELGNGSSEAGARKLYAMMERVQHARAKTVGKGKVATNSRAEKHLPA